jgi:AraC family transcriptional regulator
MTKKEKTCEDIIMTILKCDLELPGNLNCEKFSKMYGLHRSHISRIFKECNRVYFSESIRRIKLLRCAFFMAGKRDLTVKEIAKIFGFKRVSYFIKSFKKIFGMTPGEFLRCI